MIKTIVLFLFSVSVCINLNAAENEVISYSALKYKIDFDKQDSQLKDSLNQEYSRVKKIALILESNIMKNDIDLEVAKNVATVDIWTNKFIQNYKPTDVELKELYKLEKPRVVAKYELRNILVAYEENADRIINMLNSTQNKKETFIKYVRSVSNDVASKQNNGLTELVDENKLNPQIKEALKAKKEGDIVKINLKDIGTQIILIEKYIPEKDATFDEAKEALENLAKRKALTKEIELLLK
ncbi:peptidylprolyl isomerase [bacterium]|nr:peptidylprolyl isomerase [bacterium]